MRRSLRSIRSTSPRMGGRMRGARDPRERRTLTLWARRAFSVVGGVRAARQGTDPMFEMMNRQALSRRLGNLRRRGWRSVGGWSRRRDSNPRPTVYETVALPLSYFGTVANGARVYQRRPGFVSVGPAPQRDYRSSRRYSRLPVCGSTQTRVASPVVGSVNTSSVRRIEALDAAVDRSSRP